MPFECPASPRKACDGNYGLPREESAEHSLGGIVGYDVAETTDENTERVAVIQRMSTAYLRTALHVDASSWLAARSAFRADLDPIARIESK